MRTDRPEMRAAVITAPGRARVMHLARPEPGAGEVLVRIEGCGVCGSNAPVWEGRSWFQYPQPPGTPGHEGWGRIEALGPCVDGVTVGQRVAVLSYRAFAEYDVAPADAVVPLPPSLDALPFPGEALGCAVNVSLRSGFQAGQVAAVVGVGFLGALIVQLAARAGVSVIAISRRAYSLEVARRFGAVETIALDDRRAVLERVLALTGGQGCDVVVEAVGLQEPLDVAGELTRERGRLVIAGYHQDGPRQVDLRLWNWRGLDVINAHERAPAAYVAGMREAVDAVARGELDPTPLFTHSFSLDRIGDALRTLQERPAGFMKALVLA
jgi:threonine dehydrogenase-like Zn-dependent dehydrogenase